MADRSEARIARRKRRSVLLVALCALVVIALAVGAYFIFRSHSKTVAQVNGTTITQQDLNRKLAFPLSQTPGIFSANGGAANQKEVNQRNLDAAINQQLLLQEAKKRGIKISGGVVNAAYSALTKSYGTASELQDKLKQANMTEAQLKSAVTDNLTIATLTRTLVPDASATEARLKNYYNSHKSRYAGAGSFESLKTEIKADYLNDTRSSEVNKLVVQLKKSADIKK